MVSDVVKANAKWRMFDLHNANTSHIAHQTIQKAWLHLPLLLLVAT